MFYTFTQLTEPGMKIDINNSINYTGAQPLVKRIKQSAAQKFAQIDNIGEGANIFLDFSGKAVLVPAVIMAASKEEEEKKEYSAIKNPIGAVVQLLLEVPILLSGTKLVGNLANEGKLDKEGSVFSYNEKLFKDKFISSLESEGLKDSTSELVEKLNKKGLSKNLKDEFEDLIAKNGSQALKKSLSEYNTAHKRLFHLQNRFCFLAAVILTPIICLLENYFLPKIMNKIKKPQAKPHNNKIISFFHFKQNILKRGAK